MRVILSADRKTFQIIGKIWRTKLDIDRLDSQIRFYRRLSNKNAIHLETLEPLERLQKRLRDTAA